MRIVNILALALVAASLVCTASADGDRSWLDDDVTDTYSRGALLYLDDPTGAGLSVYGNPYVFYTDGPSAKSKGKKNKDHPDKGDWFWASGSGGTWSYTADETFVTYQLTSPPTYVYVGRQPVAYVDYRSGAFFEDDNALWVQGQYSWARRVVAPFGSRVWLLAYTSTGGRADVYKIRPSGETFVVSAPIYAGYNHMSFYADVVGRHIVTFVKDDLPSNSIIVDVV